jgi:putative hydroxymethylpyrimidine transport system substrate-binding protein
MRQAWISTAVIVAAAILTGCGAGQSTDTVTLPHQGLQDVDVSLDKTVNAANVAIELGMERGYFEDAGLNLWAGSPILPDRPVQYATTSTDDIALTQQPQVVLSGGNGAHVVAVGSLISQPTAAMIWLRGSKIRGISDLEGKTIAVPGIPSQEQMLDAVLARAGLSREDVEVKPVAYDLVPALVAGRADAIFGGSWNIEGIELRKRGMQPVIRRVQELGVPSYDELVVITDSDRAAREPQMVRDFMSALARSVAAMKEDPQAAIKLVEASNKTISHPGLEAQIKATIPLMSPTMRIEPGQTNGLTAWMHEEGMIARKPSFSDFFTNEYLPGEG